MKDIVRNAVRKQCDDLLKKKNVVGVMSGNETKNGIKTGREAAVVLVTKKENVNELNTKDLVPSTIFENEEAVPTDVIEVGEIKALHTNKHRPVLPGTSIGHFAITAGTLGIVVEKNGQKFILSNNHVLANENNASVGDAILQPGPHDGGTASDKIGELAEYIPINFSGSNVVDAALARFNGDTTDPTPPPGGGGDGGGTNPPDDDSDCSIGNFVARVVNWPAKVLGRRTRLKAIRPRSTVKKTAVEGEDYNNTPLNFGPITRLISTVNVGDTVKKSGRTTGVTVDEVLGLDANINVGYTNGTAHFMDQIVCGPMSAGGDSGSVVYDAAGNAIGLLFAGSDTVTIVNPIHDVFNTLNVEKIA